MMCNKVPEFSFYPEGSNQGRKTTNSKFHDPRGWIFLVRCGNTCKVKMHYLLKHISLFFGTCETKWIYRDDEQRILIHLYDHVLRIFEV